MLDKPLADVVSLCQGHSTQLGIRTGGDVTAALLPKGLYAVPKVPELLDGQVSIGHLQSPADRQQVHGEQQHRTQQADMRQMYCFASGARGTVAFISRTGSLTFELVLPGARCC